jgi:amino-acid N-acetyltransferase
MDLSSSIREVFSYISRFKGQLFVLKIEDSLLSSPQFPSLIKDIAQLHQVGIKVLIVPGTRQSIDRQLAAYELESDFEGGIRLTSEEALPLVEQASLGASQRILSYLTANGIHGVQGNWVQAQSLGIVDGVDFMRTGRPERIDRAIIEKLIADDFVPLLPPIGWNKLGHAYNISSTELATELCRFFKVGKLFFIGTEPGVEKNGEMLSALSVEEAEDLLALSLNPKSRFSLSFAQRDYLQNAVRACRAGATRVHLLSGVSQGGILEEVFSSRGSGTMVYANEYWSLRPAKLSDVPDMLRIMQDYVEKGFLIPRSQDDIAARLADYAVYVVDNAIHGCGALHIYDKDSGNPKAEPKAEVAAIAVGANYKSAGVGEAVVRHLLTRAKSQGVRQAFLLTTQAADWFYSLGFRTGTVRDLPAEKRAKYNPRRNSRVLVIDV